MYVYITSYQMLQGRCYFILPLASFDSVFLLMCILPVWQYLAHTNSLSGKPFSIFFMDIFDIGLFCNNHGLPSRRVWTCITYILGCVLLLRMRRSWWPIHRVSFAWYYHGSQLPSAGSVGLNCHDVVCAQDKCKRRISVISRSYKISTSCTNITMIFL